MSKTPLGRSRISALSVTAALFAGLVLFVAPQQASAAIVQTLAASATGSGSVTVSWDQPTGALANDYSYTVYFRRGSSGGYTTRQVSAGTESTVLSSLDGGFSYEIKVTATPASGVDVGKEGCNTGGGACTSFDSAASTSVTAATVPSAPTITGVTAGNGQISVAFSAGATNGATVSQHTATCGSLSNTGTSSPIVVTGLTNGISRTCTLTTGSNVGDSSASAASDSATPSTSPDTMAAPTVSEADASVSVTWTAVSATSAIGGADASVVDDAGSAITGYTIQVVLASDSSDVGSPTSAAANVTSATVSGLTNGTTYKAKIRATNANGSGSWSAESASFTPTSGAGATPSLTVSTQPGNVNSGAAFSGGGRPVVTVGLPDVVVTAAAVSGATLSGTTTATSDGSGVATFSNLIVTRSTTGTVQLRFTATGYNPATSSAFTVTVPPASGGETEATTTTTVPGTSTTTTVRPSGSTTTVRQAVVTTTTSISVRVVGVTVPKRLGTEVAALPQPASRVADDATVAVKPKTLTVLLSTPTSTRTLTVSRYIVTITPIGKGTPITRTINVAKSGTVTQSFSNLNGLYKVSVNAVNKAGRSLGTWKTPNIRVRG